MKLLVTGANGFVGNHLCRALSKRDVSVLAISRSIPNHEYNNITYSNKSLTESADWAESLKGIDVVIHLAGRAHVMQEESQDSYSAYAKINIDVTKNLAKQAAMQGVKRFIFLSSIKVNGESTQINPFTENDLPAPEDDYGKTKYEAEIALKEIARSTGIEIVIVRPPLVYGPGVKANFQKLITLCKLSVPLPLGAVKNKRSLIYVGNLVSFIQTCITSTNAANQTFLISDGQDISTTVLIKFIKQALKKKDLLIPIPQSLLTIILLLIGKQSFSDRLFGNLQANISKADKLLNWKPKYSVQEGIMKTIHNIDND